MRIRILIADRQNMFRETLRRMLESEPDFEVVGETGDGEQLLKLAVALKPDVLLLDPDLRKRSGIELLQQIAALKGAICPILLIDRTKKMQSVEAIRYCARGIVCKDESPRLLYKSIRTVMSGEYWISRSGICELVQNLRSLTAKVEQSTQLRTNGLSRQQQQIIESIVAGCSNKDIAKELSISERTVKYHLTRIYSALGVTGRMQLARYTLKSTAPDLSLN